MTQQEAALFFQLPEGEDAEDYFQAQLFEYKRFFISKVPIKKVFLAKVEKLLKLQEAYQLLYGIEETERFEMETSEVQFGGNWLSDFNVLQLERSRFKQLLFIQQEAGGISNTIKRWLHIEDKYMSTYSIWDQNGEENSIVVSQEPNPMEFLSELEETAQKMELIVSELIKKSKDLPKLLQNELKRLTLLRQMNLEWEKQ